MHILVTGANGMLGSDICQIMTHSEHEITPTDVTGDAVKMDITDRQDVRGILERYQPEVVIHCAAWTNVDGAEQNLDAAYRLNALGSWNMASECAEMDIPLCAISTDFVFNGKKSGYYTEFDTPAPLSVYGASKWAGEQAIQRIWRKHWIVRTAWLFGVNGKSFPNSIMNAAARWKTGDPPLRIVADQTGTPTFTRDLATVLMNITTTPLLYGVYHCSNHGVTTWYEFARKALELSGYGHVPVLPIRSADWPTPTPRPSNSALRPLALEMQGSALPQPWENALECFVKLRSEKRST